MSFRCLPYFYLEVKLVEITKEKFERFIKLQAKGRVNMLTKEVREITGLTFDEHVYIVNNYLDLCREYNIRIGGRANGNTKF